MHLGNYYISQLLLTYFSFPLHWTHSFAENHELTSPFTPTTVHISDFCCKTERHNQEKDVSIHSSRWCGIQSIHPRKPNQANIDYGTDILTYNIHSALKQVIKGQFWKQQKPSLPRRNKERHKDNLRMLWHCPHAILRMQCHLSLWELYGYSLIYFLLGGLEWLLLANIQFIPAITSSWGQLKKQNSGVPSLETITATIILVAFRMILVSQNSKGCGYGKLLCRNTSFPT